MELVRHTRLVLGDTLQEFNLGVADGTVLRLHDQRAAAFPGTRGKAEFKRGFGRAGPRTKTIL